MPVQPEAGQRMASQAACGEQRGAPRAAQPGAQVGAEVAERLVVPPVVGDLLAGHALAPHGEVEHAPAGPVGEVKLDPRLVQQDLHGAGLVGDLHAAAGEDERAPRRTGGGLASGHRWPPAVSRSRIRPENRSASAAIVRDGFGPTGPGSTDPSAMKRPGWPKASPWSSTTPRRRSLAMGAPPSGCAAMTRCRYRPGLTVNWPPSSPATAAIVASTRLKYSRDMASRQSTSR